MHRQNLDVGSVAALLLQTEASLSALHRPSSGLRDDASGLQTPDTDRHRRHSRSHATADCGLPLKRSGSSGAVTARNNGSRSQELEAQVLHLGVSVGRLEQRLREDRGLAEARRLSEEKRLEAFLEKCEKRLQVAEDSAEDFRRGVDEAVERGLQSLETRVLDVCERRLSAGEDQLRQVGDTLRAEAEASAEDLRHRTDERLEDLRHRIDERLEEIELSEGERTGAVFEEVRDGLRRLQADSHGFQGRLEQCTLAEDLDKRLRLVDRGLQKRMDERLEALERQAKDRCAWLENGTEAVAQRCRELDRRLSERLSCQAGLVDAVVEQLPRLVPFRECQDQVHALACTAETERQRLQACEASVAQFPMLRAKVEEMEAHVGKQLEEQAQTARCLKELAQRLPQHMPDGVVVERRLAEQAEEQAQTAACLRELAQRLPQKLADVEQICQRAERQGTCLEARLHARLDEDTGRVGKELEALQQRLAQRVDEAEARLQHTATRMEREGKEHVDVFSRKAESRLKELEAQADRLVEAGIRHLQEMPSGSSPASVAFDGKAQAPTMRNHTLDQQQQQSPQHLQVTPQQPKASPRYHRQGPTLPLQQQQAPHPNPFSSGTSSTGYGPTLPYARSYSSAEVMSNTPLALYGDSAQHQPLGMPGGQPMMSPGMRPYQDDAECCGLF
uniref:Uncharacterized protein n=1 Tax=Alexandrium monilatum TaxID=311494 RepID=A0A7S4QS89_9DINO|mmetsp:Transcript_15423/g.47925  ORF Transcript_15423/g.47925 Transcript_15423/m.47925 type:complete len:676 (+) Transcript_15423:39-2066(+)